MPSSAHAPSECGFTLIDALVAVALLSLALLLGATSLSRRPAEAHATALALQSAIVYTRSLAATNADTTNVSGTGATLAVVPQPSGGETIEVFRGRPIAGTTQWPSPDEHFAPIRTHGTIALSGAGITHADPPFAVLVSTSGLASVVQNFDMSSNRGSTLDADPGCPGGAFADVTIDSGSQQETHRLSCAGVSYGADVVPSPGP